jgi:hypothetical protein
LLTGRAQMMRAIFWKMRPNMEYFAGLDVSMVSVVRVFETKGWVN